MVFDLIYLEGFNLPCSVPPPPPPPLSLLGSVWSSVLTSEWLTDWLAWWIRRCVETQLLLTCPDGTFTNPISLTKGVFFKHAGVETGCTLRPRDHTWINLVCLLLLFRDTNKEISYTVLRWCTCCSLTSLGLVAYFCCFALFPHIVYLRVIILITALFINLLLFSNRYTEVNSEIS